MDPWPIILLSILISSTCANVNVSNVNGQPTVRSVVNETSNKVNVSSESPIVSNVTFDDHDDSSATPDLFGRRFINFLSRRQSKVKVSKSDNIKYQYLKFAQSIKDTTDDFLSTFLPIILKSLSTIELSDKCSGQVYRLIQGLYHQQTWAFKLIDSNGKLLPSGLLSGTTSDLGDYNQCMDIESLSQYDDHHFNPVVAGQQQNPPALSPTVPLSDNNGGHFSDDGSLRPSPTNHDEDDDDQDEVSLVTSNQRTSTRSSQSSGGQFINRLQGQYCLMSFKPLLPPSSLIEGQESGLNKKIQYLMAQYTDSLGVLVNNRTLETKLIGFISNHLKKFKSLTEFKTGLCVPSGCSSMEIKSVADHVIGELDLPVTKVSLGHRCWTKDSGKEMSGNQLIALIVVTIVLIVVVTGTVVDVFNIHIKRRGVLSVPHLILISFSARRNLRKLTYFNYVPKNLISSKDDNSEKFSSLHGIRVLTMVWLIVTNTFIFGVIYKIFWIYRDGDKILHSLNSDWVQFIFHGWTAISDVYFSLSGFILTSNLLSLLEESKGKLPYTDLITHRLIRILPIIIGSTCIYILFPFFSNGPVFSELINDQISKSCSTNWWTSILLISNWFPMDQQCIPSGWYFSADFQLYLIAPLVIFIVHKSHNLGNRVLLILIISYVIINTIISYLFDLTPILTKAHFFDDELLKKFIQSSLMPTYQHILSFMAGILAASYVHHQSYKKVSQVYKLLILIMLSLLNGSLTLLLPSLSGWNYNQRPGNLDVLDTVAGYDDGRIPFIALMAGQLMKPLRVVLIVWILICFTANGTFLFKNLLKSKKFIILSRLSSSFCLIHYIPIYWTSYNVTGVKDFNLFNLATDSMVNMIYALILSVVLNLLFESPLIQFEKGFKKRILKNEITKLRSLRPMANDQRGTKQRLADVVC